MTTLKIHDIESAPEGSKALLEQSLKQNGMIPGLHGVLNLTQTVHTIFIQ